VLPIPTDPPNGKTNYAFARRQRDLAKKQKQEEKRRRKTGTPDAQTPIRSPASFPDAPDDTPPARVSWHPPTKDTTMGNRDKPRREPKKPKQPKKPAASARVPESLAPLACPLCGATSFEPAVMTRGDGTTSDGGSDAPRAGATR